MQRSAHELPQPGRRPRIVAVVGLGVLGEAGRVVEEAELLELLLDLLVERVVRVLRVLEHVGVAALHGRGVGPAGVPGEPLAPLVGAHERHGTPAVVVVRGPLPLARDLALHLLFCDVEPAKKVNRQTILEMWIGGRRGDNHIFNQSTSLAVSPGT